PKLPAHAGKDRSRLRRMSADQSNTARLSRKAAAYPREIAVAHRLWTRRDIVPAGPTTRGGGIADAWPNHSFAASASARHPVSSNTNTATHSVSDVTPSA